MEQGSFLTENGKRLFELIQKHCEAKGIIESIDGIELSMLAHEYDKYAMAAQEVNKKPGVAGLVNTFDNGTVQVNAYHTIMKDAYDKINKNSGKFGLTPGDRAKIFKDVAKKEEAEPLAALNGKN